MSNSVVPLKIVQTLDPVTRINSERSFAVFKGGDRVTYKPVCTTSYTNSTFQFSAPPPSPGTIVDRKILLKVPVTIDFVGTSTGSLLNENFDSFAAYPLSNAMNTLAVSINNTSISINMSDVINPLLRYNTDSGLKDREYSTTPSMLDQKQRLRGDKDGNRNPLAPYNSSFHQTRGGFPFKIISNGATSAQITADLAELLYLSPLSFGKFDHAGFIGVQNMDFNITFNNDLGNRMWSHGSGGPATLTSVTVNFGQPCLLFKYITPNVTEPIPRSAVYDYYSVNRYPTTQPLVPALAPNISTTIQSQNIQLQSIPRRLYIFARKANRTFNDPDAYLAIENISVNWNNNSGLLSSASKEDLYQISVDNGCDLSWSQWSGGPIYNADFSDQEGSVGSILALEMGKDICLNPDECPGQLGTYQLQLNVGVKNVNQVDSLDSVTLFLIVVSEGAFTILDNNAVSQIGVVTKKDVINSKDAPMIDYEELNYLYGGNFFSGLKDFASRIWSGIKKALPYVSQGVKTAAQILPMLGLGKEEEEYIKEMLEERGSGVVGGKRMTRRQLRRRLQ